MKNLPAEKDLNRFGKIIMEWSRVNPRPMPWNNFSDPYSIWIAEVILQQTRVSQGVPYFKSFLQKFPDVETLASATEEEVLIAWEGLGYYSRARHLHQAARYVADELGGQFPDSYDNLLELKGVGPYTAAAIASFAFEEPVGVVDGNVKRVISRVFGVTATVDDAAVHRHIQSLVNAIVRIHSSSSFNQSIMNFGALQCIPRNPACTDCPVRSYCIAFQKDLVAELPKKKISQKKKEVAVHFGLYISKGRIALQRNITSNIWKGLYLFPQIGETKEHNNNDENRREGAILIEKMNWLLTHRNLDLHFHLISDIPETWKETPEIIMVKSKNLKNFALPRPLRLFLKKNSCNLGLNQSV